MKQNLERRKYFEARAFPHIEALYRTALYVSDSESDARDLVQETFAGAYRFWHKYQFNPDSRVWFFRLLANALSNKYRPSLSLSAVTNNNDEIDRHSSHPQLVDQQPIDEAGLVPFSVLSKDDVKNAISNLPDDFRLIVVLSLLEGFTYEEIASIVGIHLETVKSKLHQGRRLIQRELLSRAVYSSTYSSIADRVRSRRTG
jgi:RNA polymerase sigma-70 factor, ECF subfamily